MNIAKFEFIISAGLGLIVIGLLIWWGIELIRNPRPKHHRDDTTSRGGWNGGRR